MGSKYVIGLKREVYFKKLLKNRRRCKVAQVRFVAHGPLVIS